MAIDESGLTKGWVRKLNALRKSVGDELAEEVFAKWLERGAASQAKSKPDPVAMKIVNALAGFENDPKFKLGNHGYTLRRAKGKGASGFIAYKNLITHDPQLIYRGIISGNPRFFRGFCMPLNKVQFQKGLSEQRFRELYGSEKRCRAALFALRWPKGFACPRCGAWRFSEITNRGLYQCSACRYQVSLTAGTIFQSTHLPLTFWFRMMYLIIKSNKRVSSIELARRLRVTQTTAWRAKRKLVQVMSEGEPDYEVDLTKG